MTHTRWHFLNFWLNWILAPTLAMFHPCIGGAKEVVEDSRHGIMIRCKDAAREREKVNATGIEVGFFEWKDTKRNIEGWYRGSIK